MNKDLDLVSKLESEELAKRRFRLTAISPDDGKYAESGDPLRPYLTPEAEWRVCAGFQLNLLETRMEFGQAQQSHVDEVRAALEKIDPLNMALLEDELKHDQQAVLAEIGRFVSPQTKALLHPGTTSYDILDSVRAYLMREAWGKVIRPRVRDVTSKICDFAEQTIDVLQVGRTHLQDTSPVPFGVTLADYAQRLAKRTVRLDGLFDDLRGKVRGIVGTGASIEMVVGNGKASAFEEAALAKLGLKPDYAATQIVHKESWADIGNGFVTLASVLANFAEDVRTLYSSAIRELASSDRSRLLGGSSADAAKDNPVDWENMAGKVAVVEGGMRPLYAMIITDLQRELRGSVQARYQPGIIMAQTYEMFSRADKVLPKLAVNTDRMKSNLLPVREFPSEAMVSILRGEGWVHPEHGDGHEFVKVISRTAKSQQIPLLSVALQDEHFGVVYNGISSTKRAILGGELDLYTGDSRERALKNIKYARTLNESAYDRVSTEPKA